MKKQIFEMFRAKSLDKDSQKNIVGGDWVSCIGDCMTASEEWCNAEYGTGTAWYPNCESACTEDVERTTFPHCCDNTPEGLVCDY